MSTKRRRGSAPHKLTSQFGRYFLQADSANISEAMQTPYYYLFCFLMWVPNYDKSHALWSLFGDVHELDYQSWWDEYGRDAVLTHEPFPVDALEDVADFVKAKKEGAIAVRLDPKSKRETIIRQFLELLDRMGIVAEQGSPTTEQEKAHARLNGAKFVLEVEVGIERLRNAYDAFVLKEEHRLTHVQIAEKLGLDRVKSGGGRSKSYEDIQESVRRCLQDAKDIIGGLEKEGRFPVLRRK